MNFDIRKKLYRAVTIALISVSIIPAVLAEVDDSNVNNPIDTTITNSSDNFAVELDNGGSFTVINNGTISSSGNSDVSAIISENNSTITNITNSGTISAETVVNNAYTIHNESGDITNLTNSGTISAVAGNNFSYAINNDTGSTITNLTNSGTLSSEASNIASYTLKNYGTITNLTNTGTISAVAGDGYARAIFSRGTITNLINTGTISSKSNFLNSKYGTTYGIDVWGSDAHITNLINSGTISAESGDDVAYGIYVSDLGGTITNLINSGTISAVATTDEAAGIDNEGTITNLINSGIISAEVTDATVDENYGIFNDGGTITNLTNTGTISGGTYDIGPTGHIVEFNNLQLGLTYSGTLPRNYSTIIQENNYGQLFISGTPTESSTGDTVYTPFAGSVYAGAHIPSGTYTNVMTGMPDANLHSTISGTLTGDGVDSVGTVNWALTEASTNNWNLTTSGGTYIYIGRENTQLAINQTAYNVGDVLKNLSAAGNFANMTTYDCNFFNGKDNCISIGGRVTKAGGTDSAAVVVAGKKLNDNVRIGGYIDQTTNYNDYKDIDINSKIPLMGIMGVWNKSADQLGLQVKFANSYQSNDATITRAVVGSSELAKGDTEIKSQSYIGEVSHQIYDAEHNITFKRFGALRYMKTELEGYREKDVNLPVTYQSTRDENLAAIIGIKAYHKISPKITLNGSLGLEHDINDNEANLNGETNGISAYNLASVGNDKNDTRVLASLGTHMYLDFGGRIEVKGMYQELRYNKDDATTVYVTYTLPF